MAADLSPRASLGIEGRAFFLTGAAGGIGAATARVLVREGARVALADVAASALAELSHELCAIGARAADVHTITLDVADAEASAAAVQAASDRFGGLDGAFNNAAIQLRPCPFDTFPLSDFHRVLDINMMGTVHCMQAQISAMLATERPGSIVNMASAAGIVALPGISAYSAAKAAVLALTRAAAVEYGARGIRVNAISPGMIYTPMTAGDTADPAAEATMIAAHPIGRLGQPEEIARTAAWLLSDASSYMLGANVVADGGYSAQ